MISSFAAPPPIVDRSAVVEEKPRRPEYRRIPNSQRSLSPPPQRKTISLRLIKKALCIPISKKSSKDDDDGDADKNDGVKVGKIPGGIDLGALTICSEEQTRAPAGDKLPVFPMLRDWKEHEKVVKELQDGKMQHARKGQTLRSHSAPLPRPSFVPVPKKARTLSEGELLKPKHSFRENGWDPTGEVSPPFEKRGPSRNARKPVTPPPQGSSPVFSSPVENISYDGNYKFMAIPPFYSHQMCVSPCLPTPSPMHAVERSGWTLPPPPPKTPLLSKKAKINSIEEHNDRSPEERSKSRSRSRSRSNSPDCHRHRHHRHHHHRHHIRTNDKDKDSPSKDGGRHIHCKRHHHHDKNLRSFEELSPQFYMNIPGAFPDYSYQTWGTVPRYYEDHGRQTWNTWRILGTHGHWYDIHM